MSLIDYIIIIVPLTFVIGMGVYCKRYIKGVSDYICSGRLAGRYVISMGNVATALAVITLIGYIEAHYKTGFGILFWNNILLPLGVLISLTGFCNYRFRETKVQSMGQFLEMRYNRTLRYLAAGLRSFAELLTNCMCPALAARFMIYYLDLPQELVLGQVRIPSFFLLASFMIFLCILICWLGGSLALTVTDTIQGFLCYPLLIVFTVFILVKYPWSECIAPVLKDRVAGESFLNPYDISKLRDFNLFALVVTFYGTIVNYANWIGSPGSTSPRTPHEGKMAGIMGAWRGQFNTLFYVLMVIIVLVTLNHHKFAGEAKAIRDDLSRQVLTEVLPKSPEVRQKIISELKQLPSSDHKPGGKRVQDAPLSHDRNLDTPHLQTVHSALKDVPGGQGMYQKFFTLYHQMMMPATMRKMLPAGLLGMFALFILLMMLSTDDSRLFSSAVTIMQDCVLPFKKAGFTPQQHVKALRLVVCGCGLFWLAGSFFMGQMDYINMAVTIICSMWLGAGPVMLFGLYSKFGNTVGAFCSLITGVVFALLCITVQNFWASDIYPLLVRNQWDLAFGQFLANCSAPFEPWIVWRMSPHKFPINSMELSFINMLLCLVMYIAGSLITYRGPFNLDRLLHRGIYNIDGENKTREKWSVRNVLSKLIGITPEFTLGDRIISWSVFFYSIVFNFFIAFVGVIVWNMFAPWPIEWWSKYFFVIFLLIPACASAVSVVWFTWGGVIDMRRLFRDLANRVDNPLDNGMVVGNVSLSDKEEFEKREKALREKPEAGADADGNRQ
jgi:Na+/proline symporter